MPSNIPLSFKDCFTVIKTDQAAFFASQLFNESFNSPFPVPADITALPVPTPKENWHQYVALYRWPDARLETVGFYNLIAYGNAYLAGGLCVKSDFYRRLPKPHWQNCAAQGGVAQLMLEAAARERNDLAAWFAYVGDKKSSIVTQRCGYQPINHPYLLVKWFHNLPETAQNDLIRHITAIGPF